MKYVVFVLTLLLLAGCKAPEEPQGFIDQPSIGSGNVQSELTLTTSDDVKIKGTLYTASGEKAVILLHMLGKDRKTWDGFARELQKASYTVLAIDLRGHGESLEQGNGRINYNSFTDKDFNEMIKDVEAANQYLKEAGKYNLIALVGASIGANLALKFAANDPDLLTERERVFEYQRKIILLSPGLEYRGVNIEQDNLIYEGPLLIVASEDDSYSAQSSKQLAEKSRGKVKLQMYTNAGHGTNMFAAQPELVGFLIDWMNG